MTNHTKQVPCDGQTEKLTCGCEKCVTCGTYVQVGYPGVTTAGGPVHVHASVTYT